MLRALVTTVRSRRSASARTTSVAVVPPVSARPRRRREPASRPARPIARFCRELAGCLVADRHLQTGRASASAPPCVRRIRPCSCSVCRSRRMVAAGHAELLGQSGHVDTAVLDHPIENLGQPFCFHAHSVRVRFGQNEHIRATIRSESDRMSHLLDGRHATQRRRDHIGVLGPPVRHRSRPRAWPNRDDVVLIEATSNQVDQFGGYTGMRPADFRVFVEEIAHRVGIPARTDRARRRPPRPQSVAEPARRDRDVARRRPGPRLRRGRLYEAASRLQLSVRRRRRPAFRRGRRRPRRPDAHRRRDRGGASRSGRAGCATSSGPRCPPPAGRPITSTTCDPPPPSSARATLAEHRLAFDRAGLGHIWPQVMALVVQPGVEFDHHAGRRLPTGRRAANCAASSTTNRR